MIPLIGHTRRSYGLKLSQKLICQKLQFLRSLYALLNKLQFCDKLRWFKSCKTVQEHKSKHDNSNLNIVLSLD